MSPKLPRLTAAELLRALTRAGWYRSHQAGSHLTLRHPDRAGKVVIPMHSGDTLAPKTLQSILDQAGMTAERLRELL